MIGTFRSIAHKNVSWGRLFGLLFGEAALLGVFFFLGSDPTRRVDFAHVGRWLDVTPPVDAVVAVALLIGAFGAFWLFATSLLYITARVFAVSALETGTSRFLLPTVRRMIDGAFALGIASSSLLGSAQMAHAAMRTPVPVVSQVDARTGASVAADEIVVDGEEVPMPAGDGSVIAPPPVASDDTVMNRPAAPSEVAPPSTTPTPISAPSADSEMPAPAGDGNADKERPAQSTTVTDDSPAPAGDTNSATTTTAPLVRPAAPVDPQGAQPMPVGAPAPQPEVGGITTSVRSYTVVKGDNFWTIAAREVRNSTGQNPTNEEVRRYWIALIEANRANISSGNPNLIYAGEQFVLPPVG